MQKNQNPSPFLSGILEESIVLCVCATFILIAGIVNSFFDISITKYDLLCFFILFCTYFLSSSTYTSIAILCSNQNLRQLAKKNIGKNIVPLIYSLVIILVFYKLHLLSGITSFYIRTVQIFTIAFVVINYLQQLLAMFILKKKYSFEDNFQEQNTTIELTSKNYTLRGKLFFICSLVISVLLFSIVTEIVVLLINS